MRETPRHSSKRHADKWLVGERIVLQLHRHWVFPVADLMLTAPAAVVGLLLAMALAATSTAQAPLLAAAVGLAAIILWVGGTWLRWLSTSLTVTDRRIVIETGMLKSVRTASWLTGVQAITTRQSLVGRIFGYSRLEIWLSTASQPLIFQGARPHRLPDSLLFADRKGN